MRCLQIAVCFLIVFAVAAHGVVEIWSESTLEIGAALLFVAWGLFTTSSTYAEIYWNALNWPIVGFFAWAILQLLFRVTVYPFLTWTALLRWGACFLIYFVTTQVFRERKDIRILTWFLVLLGFSVALEGIIQNFAGGGKIYGFRELHLGGAPFGPYVNRNHFAGLMELLAPVGLSFLAFRGIRRELAPLVGLFTLVPVAAIFMDASRGGLVTFAFELSLLAIIYVGRRSGKMRLGPVIAFMLVVASLVAWLGVGGVLERFSVKGAGEVTNARRWTMTKGTLRVFLAHPITGTGLGTLVVEFPRYDTDYDGKLVDHAHNDYAELLAELGLPGAICGIAFLWLLLQASIRALQTTQIYFSVAYHIAALVACAGLLFHSFVDFNLHIPSNALLFMIQASLLTSPPMSLDPVNNRKQRAWMTHSVVDIQPSASA